MQNSNLYWCKCTPQDWGGGEGWFTQMFIPPSEVTWKSSGSFYFTKKERAKSELFLNSI